ncbi:MAG: hypothetical protein ACP5NZ_01935, partial [Nanobdellota archaeon]
DSEDELIIDQIDTLHGYYSKGSPKTKNQDLESAIRGQVQTFQKNLERGMKQNLGDYVNIVKGILEPKKEKE